MEYDILNKFCLAFLPWFEAKAKLPAFSCGDCGHIRHVLGNPMDMFSAKERSCGIIIVNHQVFG